MAKEGVEGGQLAALHIYALGLDGGMGDLLQTIQVACRVHDALYVLAKAPSRSIPAVKRAAPEAAAADSVSA